MTRAFVSRVRGRAASYTPSPPPAPVWPPARSTVLEALPRPTVRGVELRLEQAPAENAPAPSAITQAVPRRGQPSDPTIWLTCATCGLTKSPRTFAESQRTKADPVCIACGGRRACRECGSETARTTHYECSPCRRGTQP